MAPRRKNRSMMALAVLATLRERPMHPYEVGRVLRERRKQDSIKIKFGTLYLACDQLTAAGLIEPIETQRPANRPKRTVYALTGAGRAELRDWMRELIAVPVVEANTFEAALSVLVVLPPDEVAGLLRDRETALDRQITAAEQDIAHQRASVDEVFLVEAQYRVVMLRAELAFVADLFERVKRGEPGFGRLWQQFHEQNELEEP